MPHGRSTQILVREVTNAIGIDFVEDGRGVILRHGDSHFVDCCDELTLLDLAFALRVNESEHVGLALVLVTHTCENQVHQLLNILVFFNAFVFHFHFGFPLVRHLVFDHLANSMLRSVLVSTSDQRVALDELEGSCDFLVAYSFLLCVIGHNSCNC